MLELKHIAKSFGEQHVLKDVNMKIKPGMVYALVGTNGSGKTTLFNIINGFLRPDQGDVILQQQKINHLPPHLINRLGISRTFQDLRLITDLTVLDNVMLAYKNQEGEKWWKAILPPKTYQRQQDELKTRAISILEKTFLSDVINEKAGEVSYGQQKLLTFACCLANNSGLLLLDEPVAGVNPAFRDKVASLVNEAKMIGKAILLIEHNADFIEQTSNKVFFLNEGICKEFESYNLLRNNQEVKEAYV